jgi:3-dehydroquinate synthase
VAIDGDLRVLFKQLMADSLTVHLQDRSYAIRFGADLRSDIRARFHPLREMGRKVAVVTDRNVSGQHGATLQEMFDDAPLLALPPGEATKSLAMLERVLDFLAEHGIDRMGTLFVVGGGVVGDLGGFAAASYLRGIDYYQVPTTLLAMVDSSVGGKTGINLRAGKNLAGSFHQPRGVFIATGFLATLPPREFAAGMAEVIKYGLLGDAELFARLEGAPLAVGSADLPDVIHRCCAIKARIVEADECERAPEGGRALLNLGHTFGHAIEQATGYGRYLHGEAVAIGLAAAARLSRELGHFDVASVARIDAVLKAHLLPARLEPSLPLAALMTAMARDKKVRAGLPRFVIMQRFGQAATRDDVARASVEAVWREVGAV